MLNHFSQSHCPHWYGGMALTNHQSGGKLRLIFSDSGPGLLIGPPQPRLLQPETNRHFTHSPTGLTGLWTAGLPQISGPISGWAVLQPDHSAARWLLVKNRGKG